MPDFDLNDLDLSGDELLETFVLEAVDDIAALEAGLLLLEAQPSDPETRRDLLRRAHSLKGNASCVGLQAITDFAHSYEELLERVNEGTVAFDAPLVTLLLGGIDTLRRLVEERAAGVLTPDDEELIAAVTAAAAGHAGAAREAASAMSVDASSRRGDGRTVRVGAEKLNRMLDLAGEIAIARGRVRQMLGSRGAALDFEALVEVEGQVDTLQVELQELIMRARMVPVGPVFRQFARIVRDVAAAHGKNARLVTIGDDVELDTTAVEMLRDPLTHMIRNALDHGLETSAERVANGKAAVGHITLEARHEAGSITIRVSDDGAGLDRRAIAARGAALGFDPIRLSDAELDRLIFEPGFSTSGAVTDLSGRGVGMDVVRRAIEALRGTIGIESREGIGTTFVIRLPLTLAMIDGFGVSVDDESYVVPMDHVLECLELPADQPREVAGGVLLLHDTVVPYVRLRHLFRLGGVSPARESVLIVEHDGAKAGLVVDALQGGSQAVIKPLGSYFSEVPGVAGSSILGNGRVALILDTPTILRTLAEESASQARSNA
ncbi:MAG: CheA signal transduction histidine kinase [Acidobacteria bacterium]|nr:CheA signal transduction histidine kinase [Acidobacteriota bacterium]